MTKKPLPSALPVEGDIFLALPLWWSSMPDSRGYRLCALRRTETKGCKDDSTANELNWRAIEEKSFQKVNWTAIEQQELYV